VRKEKEKKKEKMMSRKRERERSENAEQIETRPKGEERQSGANGG